jgi:23S rRNA pseudouridine1911/1915/1917 synthase
MGKQTTSYDILLEDDQLLFLNKAAHVLSIPDRFKPENPNLYHMLTKRYGKIFVVHRLDKETSGVMCFAKTEEAHKSLSRQFEQRTTEKVYLALCEGVPLQKEDSIDLGIAPHPSISGKMIVSNKGKTAQTTYKVLEEFKAFALLQAQIHTGRTHQVRVHLHAIGHPLAVDSLYNHRSALFLSEFKRKAFHLAKNKEERPLLARNSLHAWKLSVLHPGRQQPIQVEAPLPKDLRAALNQLRKWGK